MARFPARLRPRRARLPAPQALAVPPVRPPQPPTVISGPRCYHTARSELSGRLVHRMATWYNLIQGLTGGIRARAEH